MSGDNRSGAGSVGCFRPRCLGGSSHILESGGHESWAGNYRRLLGSCNLELLKAVMVQVLALSSLTDSGRPLNVEAYYLGLLETDGPSLPLASGSEDISVVSWQGSGVLLVHHFP